MPAEAQSPRLTWNIARDVSQLLEYHFMVNALLAGTAVAIAAGVVGWVMVLRREAFAGHTLSVMAFPGASAAALAGVPAAWGYLSFCAAGALAIGRLGGRSRAPGEQPAVIAAVQVAALALGFLLLSLYGGVLADLEEQLFGTFLGVSDAKLALLAAVALLALVAMAVLGRPLLLSSVDAQVADARGLPVRGLTTAFLLVLGVTVAATAQVTGVLLVFALLVGPPASAQALTARPLAGVALSVVLGVLVVWVGLGISYFSIYPAGFFVSSTSFACYVSARLLAAVRASVRRDEPALGAA